MRSFILLLLASVITGHAATYYVDFESGLDSNDGTSTGSPWKHYPGDTAATGVADTVTLSPGDTVKFKGGVVYTNMVDVLWSGTEGNPITYDGNTAGDWGGGKAVIDRNYVLNGYGVRMAHKISHIKVDGFEIRNVGGLAEDDPIVLAAANGDYGNDTNAIKTPYPGTGVGLVRNNTNIVVANTYIHHVGIWYSTYGWNGSAVSGVAIAMYSPKQVTVTNCEITKVGASGILIHAYTEGIRDVRVTDSYLHDDIPAWGMDIASAAFGSPVITNLVITKTRFIDLWSDWSGTPEDTSRGLEAPHQNYLFMRSPNPAIWTNVYVTRCFFGETSDIHLLTGGTGSIFLSQGPSVNIFNNVFSRPWTTTGIIFVGWHVPESMHQVVRIYNNTIYRGSGPSITSSIHNSYERKDVYIQNNIFIDDAGLRANDVIVAIGTYNEPDFMDNNLYWASDWTVSQKYLAVWGSYSTLATLRGNGHELSGLYTDPLLADYSNPTPVLRDYRPTANSPAIGAGANLSEYFTEDYDGNPRPLDGNWTIGAYETEVSGPGTLLFSASGFMVDENAGTATITVVRTGGSEGVVGVSYATSDGSATAGNDYTAASGTLTWEDGETEAKTFTVSITDDAVVENDETLTLRLSSATGGAVLGSIWTATLTILNEDVADQPPPEGSGPVRAASVKFETIRRR